MLSQLDQLSRDTDGRYASDEELQFLEDYAQTYSVRMQTYLAIQAAETAIIQETYSKLRALDSQALMTGEGDISRKWKADTLRTLRYSAAALLVNDPETLSDRFLLWFQTLMKAFGAQRSCRLTYEVMQEVIKSRLTPQQSALLLPLIDLNRRLLGLN